MSSETDGIEGGIEREAYEAFAAGFRGELVRPGDEGYDEARAVWNGTVDRRPAVIARCTGTADVVAAVTFAREADLPLAVRGGGHNVAGFAVCDDGVVVDLSGMRAVSVDPAARTVRVQGGATIGDLDRETQLFGLATPMGVVSATGIAGLTLNGGLGHLRSAYGLACDALVSAEVVTADGRVLTASADSHPDLFWALRGGGGNFGVVTGFEYRLYEVGPEVDALFVWYDGDDAEAVLDGVRAYAAEDDRGGSIVAFRAVVPSVEEFPEEAWGDPAVAILGCHVGSVDARAAGVDGDGDGDDAAVGPDGDDVATRDVHVDAAAFDDLRRLATPIVDHSDRMPYVDLQSMLDADYPDGLRYYWKAVYVDELTDGVLDVIERYGESMPSPLSTIDVWPVDGAVTDVDPGATAFGHREPGYLLTFEANWEAASGDEANVGWGRRGVAALRSLPVARGGYGNFPGHAEDPARTLYGGNYDRLVAVKTTYDPENLFRHNQNVEPAPPSSA